MGGNISVFDGQIDEVKKYENEYALYMLNFLTIGFDEIIHSEILSYEEYEKKMEGDV